MQTLDEIRTEAKISKRLWVKVLGMLQQNWCVVEPGPAGSFDLVFFYDQGEVFDWLSAPDMASAQYALHVNGFSSMWTYSSFYSVAGMPRLPESGVRERNRPIYSGGEYWETLIESELGTKLPTPSIPTTSLDTDLFRFSEAQDLCWYTVVEEIARGQKETHWMWFIFPQLRGLGSSRFAQYFGLANPREAAGYWDDNLLGDRLRTCINLLLDLPEDTQIERVFGAVDAMKLRSCMTIFEAVSYEDTGIVQVLDRYFGSERCPRTLDMMKNSEVARPMRISRMDIEKDRDKTGLPQKRSEKLKSFIDNM
jgi:uncharacterized protein (DUF1810 family)